jgi:chemotaxis protein CheX
MNTNQSSAATTKPLSESRTANNEHGEWLSVIELATREVFEMMLGCQLEEAQPELAAFCDTTSIVGLAGKLSGTLTVSCGAKSATLMASKMLAKEALDGSREVSDALGEVCNMVAGNFKNKIPGLDDGCMLSVPIVITGKNYSTHSLGNSSVLDLKLLFEGMPFFVRLQIRG